jgi:hypothetical protein
MVQTSASRDRRSVHASKVSRTLRLIEKETRSQSTAAGLARAAVSFEKLSQKHGHRPEILFQWRKININSPDQGPFGVPKITGSDTKNPTKNEKSRISSSSSRSNRRCFMRQLADAAPFLRRKTVAV